jgi:glutamyl-tRNA synthetase
MSPTPDGEVRVRFAPSPTGAKHIGNARTALFNWLFARRHGGTFILRVEDTDRARYLEEGLDEIQNGLRWLGLDWDEGPGVGGAYGPYIQSERLPIYRAAADRLLETGAAYHCYCSPERLEEMRREQAARKEPTRYDRRCRNLTADQRRACAASGEPAVVRFAVPLGGETTFHDEIRGDITYPNEVLDDFVLMKSDGWPTYHLAATVDDHEMCISHVLRGEDWIPSTPRHVLLYRAFSYDLPKFGHLPLINGPDGRKLSSRHGALSTLEYRDAGYLSEALVNFLALLGWSPGDDRELLSRAELIEAFDLGQVKSSPAIFDLNKLEWMNGVYIRQLPLDDLVERSIPFLVRAGLVQEPLSDSHRAYVSAVLALEQERVKRLEELPELTDFFFREEPEYDAKAVEKWTEVASTPAILRAVSEALRPPEDFSVEAVETAIRGVITELGVGSGDVIHPTRVAATGRTRGPGLFETLTVLGKDRVLRRLARFAEARV